MLSLTVRRDHADGLHPGCEAQQKETIVTEYLTPVDVAVAFTRAWTSHDMAAAARYVADDVVFEGPMTQTTGAQAYLAALSRFAETVTGMQIIAELGDAEGAMIMYEVETGEAGVLRAGEHFVIREGKIHRDMLVFDTHNVRQAQSAQPPTG
jgi:limonene-1,2-epoxide hydrolase